MGGSGRPAGRALAASYADEYNTAFARPGGPVRERRDSIAAACEAAGREPIPFSVMTPVIAGRDEADLQCARDALGAVPRHGRRRAAGDPPEGWHRRARSSRSPSSCACYEEPAVRVLCQHLPHDDLEFVQILGRELAPLVA